MKKLIYTLFWMLVFLPGCVSGDAGSDTALAPGEARIVIGTFNVHYISPRQTKMIWEERRDGVVEVLRQGNADIIGFQEMETFVGGHWNDENKQLDWVLAHFPEYAATSVGDPRRYPWTQPILYRKSRFEALEQGFFFFSPHPDQIYSRSWTGGFPAFCSGPGCGTDRAAKFSMFTISISITAICTTGWIQHAWWTSASAPGSTRRIR